MWVNSLVRTREPIRIRRAPVCPICTSKRATLTGECWRCLACGVLWPACATGVIRDLINNGYYARVTWHEAGRLMRKLLPVATLLEDNPPPAQI